MTKILNSTYKNSLTYLVDVLVEKQEYNNFVAKVRKQLLSSVEVPGFRAGKAPEEMLMKQINPVMLYNTILSETIQKFSPEAVTQAKADLEKDDRLCLGFDLDYDVANTKETEEGFVFRMIGKLIAKIDLDQIVAVKYTQPSVKELKDRPSLEEFKKSEHTRLLKMYNKFEVVEDAAQEGFKVTVNMTGRVEGKNDDRLAGKDFQFIVGGGEVLPEFETAVVGAKKSETKSTNLVFPANYFEETLQNKNAEFEIEVLEVSKPLYTKIEDAIENHESLKKQFVDIAGFEKYIADFYETETKKQLEDFRQRNIIEAIVEQQKDLEIDQDKYNSETDRIFKTLLEESESKKISLAQEFINNGLPTKKSEKLFGMDNLQIREEVASYVKNEFILSQILNYIYETKVEQKPTEKEMKDVLADVKKNPAQYGYSGVTDENQLIQLISDRIMRQSSAKYLFDAIK